jgi:membrane protein
LTAGDRATALGIKDRVRRGLVLGWRATGRGVIEFYHSNNLTFASSIAYYSLLSVFPFILMVLTVLSRLAVGQAGNERAVIDLVERALPSNFDFLSTQLVQLQKTPIPLTIAGTIITLWASMGVFGAVTSAVNHAWGVEKPYSYFKHKLIAFVMMIAAALVFASALLLMGAVQVAHTAWFPSIETWFPWLPDLKGLAAREAFGPASVLAIGLVYYFAPNTKVRLRDVWFGAILAAALWRLALAGFSWYLRDVARFSVHGSVGAVVAFLVWVYLSAVILLYGVEVTAAYARARMALDESQRSEVKTQT